MIKTRRQSTRQTSQKSSLKRIFFTGLFFCLLAGLAYFLICSPIFWLDEVKVSSSANKLKANLQEEIVRIVQRDSEEKFWQFIPQKSILLVPLNKIKEDILNKFPQIKVVKINKKRPRLAAFESLKQTAGAGLEISIEERKRIGIWCQVEEIVNEEQSSAETESSEEDEKEKIAEEKETTSQTRIKNCFYLDEEGIIFQESPLISGSLILNIYSSKDEQVELRQQVLSPETIDFILTLEEELPKIKTTAGLSWQLSNFEIISPEDIRAEMSTGWQIYFNPAYSAESQLKTLEMILEKQIEETVSLEYIDLRIKNRVYYR